MIKIDKNTVADLESRNIEKIKVFFYDAGCSGTKINISEDFEIENHLTLVESDYNFLIYIDKRDEEKLKNCSVTKTITADHTGKEKVRYIYSSEEVKGRCGCGSSFNFGKEKPKLNLNNLKDFKNKFKK